MFSCHDLYLDINKKGNGIINETFDADVEGKQSKSHSFLMDLSVWLDILQNRPEAELLDIAFREYQYALLAVVQGQYRQAYNSLRFFVEHSLAAIHFSANEYQLRLWMKDGQDIYWQTIIDENNGIFSKNFVKAFYEELIDDVDDYRLMAQRIYRQCSEFTHGNYGTHSKLPRNLEFRKDIFDDWQDKAETGRIIITFALVVRYFKSLTTQDKCRLESIVMEHLGYITEVLSSYESLGDKYQ